MSLRRRLALLSGLAVAVTVMAAAVVGYLAVRGELRGEIDDSLRRAGAAAARLPFDRVPPAGLPRPDTARPLGGPQLAASIVRSDGTPRLTVGIRGLIPHRREFAEVAAGRRGAHFSDAHTSVGHARLYVAPIRGNQAVVVARTVGETDDVLGDLRLIFVALVLAGTVVAALLGRALAASTVTPIEGLEEAAAHVADTTDLTRRIEERGPGEVVSLARQFNLMLGALEESVAGQRQLIADASHELRTPITTLRTNVEVLESVHRLSEDQRRELLTDVRSQLEDFNGLIDDIIELARSAEGLQTRAVEPLAFDRVVAEAVAWAERHWPERRFVAQLAPMTIEGDRERLGRAVRNLLDNAAKWSPAGERVEVTLRHGTLVVRDHGPGVSPADLPHVFDRFYRASTEGAARRGSGLGLAIVREVAESHGGRVEAANAEGGGAELRWRLGG